MDAERLRDVVATGETLGVELKGEKRSPFKDQALVEAVVCLANGHGGLLLIGVEDDGRITGCRPRHRTGTDVLRVQALVANSTVPPLTVGAELVDVDDVQVLTVEVPRSPRTVGTRGGLYLRRTLGGDGRPACVPYLAHEMLAAEIDRGAVDYAQLPLRSASWDDLDPLELDRARQMLSRPGTGDRVLATLSDTDLLRALGVARVDGDGLDLMVGALLLFGRPRALERHVPTHRVAFQVLRGSAVEVNDIRTVPLLRAATDLHEQVLARQEEDEVDVGLLRVALPRFPEVLVREVVANALVHRDYTAMGVGVQVQITDDSLDVTSTGGLPRGVTLDSLLVAQQPRSPVLADTFKRLGLVERTGRGIDRMFDTMLRVGRDVPDYSRTTDAAVTASISLGRADADFVRLVQVVEQEDQRPFSLAALLVLRELRRGGPLDLAELEEVTQQTRLGAQTTVADLRERGLVEARGSGRGRTYLLSAGAYRRLGRAAAYQRVRGFEADQQRQLVLGHVRAHGSITRGEVADVCAVTPRQASYLLTSMVSGGLLRREGERRWARYVLP